MSLFLTVIIVSLLACFLIFFKNNKKMNQQHRSEIVHLKNIISDLLLLQNQQNGAVKLSDDLKIKLHNSRVEIDKKLLNLQNELIEKLIDNRLADSF